MQMALIAYMGTLIFAITYIIITTTLIINE